MRIKRIDVYARSREIGAYVIDKQATVRETAQVFKVSKSTVHKDLTERLQEEDIKLYEDVRKVLDTNKQERAARGGEATKQKYMQRKRVTTK